MMNAQFAPTQVCYVVASKDVDGLYTPEEFVFPDLEEAIRAASDLLDDAPTCDPRVIQVILSPSHQTVVTEALVAEIAAEIKGTKGAYKEGLEKAIEVLRTWQPPIDINDIDHGGTL
jgi:hypothetical protein